MATPPFLVRTPAPRLLGVVGALEQVLVRGALYFVIVFAAGFALGAMRVLWLEPALGPRLAELCEAPAMLVVTVLSASWITNSAAVPLGGGAALGMGLVGLGLLVAVELTFVLWVRGLTFSQYVATRDPVAGVFYLGLLAAFAAMPALVRRPHA